MEIFLEEYFLILAMLIGFSIASGFAVVPFRNTIKYAIFISPLAGILFLTLGTSTLYSLLQLTLVKAAMITFALCAIVTVIAFLSSSYSLFKDIDYWIWLLIALVAIFVTYMTNYTSITFSHPGILFRDGTDHLGYAQLADWLNNHLAFNHPKATPEFPYQSWPEYMFQNDPRFGSLFTLGIISVLHGYSGTFSYDIACAVVLIAGFLAVSAVFARSPLTFALIFLGLLTTHWIDYSRSGYFGKILGYPSALLCVGLFFNMIRPFVPVALAVLVGLSAATTTMHSGLSTILFLVTLVGTYLVIHFVNDRLKQRHVSLFRLKDDFAVLILLVGVAIASMGILARPNYTGVAYLEATWYSLLPRLFDLETLTNGPRYSHLGSDVLFIGFIISVLIAITFLIVAVKKRDVIATSLIAGPFLLLLVLIMKDQKWLAYQLIGTFYPFFLCAAVRVIDDFTPEQRTKNIRYKVILALLIIAISIHLPRLMGALQHYAGRAEYNKKFQFSQAEIDKLAVLTKGSKTTIDVTNPQLAIVLLVELERRQDAVLQWTPAAWKTIVGYRPLWPAPKLDKKSKYWIDVIDTPSSFTKNCKVMYTTTQFRLLDCQSNTVSKRQ